MRANWSMWGGVVSAAILIALALSAPALAQEALKPPAVEAPGKGSAILSYLVAALLGLVAITLCAMPSRRTHQD
jgi:hypothetical protein